MENLKILGTSHIAKESIERVKEEIESGQYDIVTLELDNVRLYSLLHPSKAKIRATDIAKVGLKGYIFSLIGAWAENKLGAAVGVKPGTEMTMAYKLAKKKGLKIALVDQRIDITLSRLSKGITWKEKLNFAIDIIKSPFVRRPELRFDLRKVPSQEIINTLIKEVKERYPNFYRILVTERNQVMARNIHRIMKQNPGQRILAIVGAGHEKELELLIKQEGQITYSFTVG
ncbi:MAG: TraB/GumN family protein [Candidatus Woesearchaeota archaeon]